MKTSEHRFRLNRILQWLPIQPKPTRQTLQRIKQRLMDSWMSIPNVKIWQHRDRSGNSIWKIYDCHTDRTISLTSEAEVRIWIEEQLYRHHAPSCSTSISPDLHRSKFFR